MSTWYSGWPGHLTSYRAFNFANVSEGGPPATKPCDNVTYKNNPCAKVYTDFICQKGLDCYGMSSIVARLSSSNSVVTNLTPTSYQHLFEVRSVTGSFKTTISYMSLLTYNTKDVGVSEEKRCFNDHHSLKSIQYIFYV